MNTRYLHRAGIVAAVAALSTILGCGDSAEAVRSKSGSAPEVVDSATEANTPEAASHERMVVALREIAEIEPRENIFVGTASLERLAAALEQAQASRDFVRYIDTLQQISDRELQLGRVETAIEHQLQANELLGMLKQRAPDVVTPEIEQYMLFRTALKYLRQGETENCIHCRTGESCILPIQGTGVHAQQRGSRAALGYFIQLLEKDPRNATARWLLNVTAMTLGEHPAGVPEQYRIPAERFKSSVDFPRFPNVAAGLGIARISLAGAAVADDFDGDRDLDLLTTDWHPSGRMQFLRNAGDGSFQHAADEANLAGIISGLNAVQADYDNDGDLDAFILRGAWLKENGRHVNSLLRNDGTGRFTDVTFAAGLAGESYPTQTAAWADFDNDGDLDLYVGNENFPCQLFENDGAGGFTDIAADAGVLNDRMAKGVVWGDFDNDRFPDIYVSNLDGENRLYRNNRDSTFSDVAAELGVTGPKASFPLWFWDYNNDGALDLYVPSYNYDIEIFVRDFLALEHDGERSRLYEGDGNGGFRDVAAERNIDAITDPMGCNFGDLDNDGYLDAYLGTGYPAYEALMPNVMYHNERGNGFVDVTFAGGFGHLQKGHGVAFADLDEDGDQDVFAVMGGAYAGDTAQDALFENPGFENNWIKVRLVGRQSNRSAIGARIKVTIEEDGSPRAIYRTVGSGGSFGCNPLRQEIGVGKAEVVQELEVYWPTSNATQTFRDVQVGQLIEITEGQEEYVPVSLKPAPFKRSRSES